MNSITDLTFFVVVLDNKNSGNWAGSYVTLLPYIVWLFSFVGFFVDITYKILIVIDHIISSLVNVINHKVFFFT